MAILSSLTARIRRVSLDAGNPENYTLFVTSAYDELDPAATTAPFGDDDVDVLAMDTALSVPVPPAIAIEAQGVVVQFEREPFRFDGVAVKVRAEYDFGAGENPALELWTQQAGSNVWTLRRRLPFASLSGAPDGRWKIFDLNNFGLSAPLSNVVRVWVTMNPGTVGTPSLEFAMVHCFGRCRLRSIQDGSCYDDPTTDCLGAGDCEDDTETCLDPPLDCEDFAPEVCDLPPFDWPKTPPSDGGPTPPSEPPEFPTIDLCDEAELTEFKSQLTPEQLTFFEELLEQSQLPCLDPEDRSPNPIAPINADPDMNHILPRQPIEVYIDPTTGEPGADPRGNGAGDTDPSYATPVSRFVFFFFSAQDQTDFVANLVLQSADVQAAWAQPTKQVFFFGNGVEYIIGTPTVQNALGDVAFTVHGVGKGDLVEVLARTAGSVTVGAQPPVLVTYPGNGNAACITAAFLNHFLVERTARLGGIPDSGVEVGGDSGALVAQRQGIVTTGIGPVVITAKAARDLTSTAIVLPSDSTEAVVNVGGPQNTVVHKHHGAGDAVAPPNERHTVVAYRKYMFEVKVTKRVDSFSPAADDPSDPDYGQPSVFVSVAHTTTDDSH